MSFMKTLVPLNKIERLSPSIVRILGCNPGEFTLQGTNTYLLGKERQRILVDTGDGRSAEYIENLNQVLREEKCKIGAIVLTHWHLDHSGGVAEIAKNVPGFSGKVYKFKSPTYDEYLLQNFDFEYIEDGDVVGEEEEIPMSVVYSPGHTDDHIYLTMNGNKEIICGDNVLGYRSSIFQHLDQYMESLELLKSFKPDTLYPGHGPSIVNCAMDKISEYIKHRNDRENQILQTINESQSTKLPNDRYGIFLSDIIQTVYKNTCRHLAITHIVNQHCQKLVKEGKIDFHFVGNKPYFCKKQN